MPMEQYTVNVDGFAVVLQSERGVATAYIVFATECLSTAFRGTLDVSQVLLERFTRVIHTPECI